MQRTTVLSLAFLLALASFPLVSIGTTTGNSLLWWLGLVLLAAGLLIPPATRFIHFAASRTDTPDVGEEP